MKLDAFTTLRNHYEISKPRKKGQNLREEVDSQYSSIVASKEQTHRRHRPFAPHSEIDLLLQLDIGNDTLNFFSTASCTALYLR